MNLILVLSLSILICLILLNWFFPYVSPKSIQFGVRIPREREADPAISMTRRSYHFRLLVGSSAVFVSAYLVPALFGYYFLTVASMALEVLFAHINYYLSFRKLHRIKLEQKWYEGLSSDSGAVYINGRTIRHLISGAYFIFPALIFIFTTLAVGISSYPQLPSSVPAHFGINGIPTVYYKKSVLHVFSMSIYQAVETSALFVIGWVLTRTSQEIDVSRPYTTYEQQNRFKSFYRDTLYVFASMLCVTFLFISLRMIEYPSYDFPLYVIALPIVMGYLMLLLSPVFLGQMGARLSVSGEEGENTGASNTDDDRKWVWGIFYYNREDPSILIGRRFGVGWTFNFGNPRSWIVVGLIATIVIALITSLLLHLLPGIFLR